MPPVHLVYCLWEENWTRDWRNWRRVGWFPSGNTTPSIMSKFQTHPTCRGWKSADFDVKISETSFKGCFRRCYPSCSCLAPLCTILPFMNSYFVPHDQTITPSRWWNIFKSLTIFVACSSRCWYFGTCFVWQVQLPTSLSIDLPLLPLAWKRHQRSWDTQHRFAALSCECFCGVGWDGWTLVDETTQIIFFKIALREDHPKTCQTCSWIYHLWGLQFFS